MYSFLKDLFAPLIRGAGVWGCGATPVFGHRGQHTCVCSKGGSTPVFVQRGATHLSLFIGGQHTCVCS